MFGKIKKITEQQKMIFVSCFIWTFVAHGTIIFNKISFHDDIEGIFSVGSTYTLGRWFLGILGNVFGTVFGGLYSVPVWYGLLSIVFIAIAACLLVEIFDIKNKCSMFVLSGIMVTIPVVTALFGFMFTAPFYLLGMLMATFGAYLLINERNKSDVFVSAILICLGCGVYQVYFTFAAGILYLYLFVYILNNKDIAIWDVLKKAFKYLCVCVTALGGYLVINKVILKLKGIQLSSYAGLDEMGSKSVIEYVKKIGITYERFFTFRNDIYPTTSKSVYVVILAVLVVLIGRKIIKKSKEDKLLALGCGILFAVFPMVINSIYIIANSVHSLMLYSQILIFVLFISEIEKIEINKLKIKSLTLESGIVLVLFTCFVYSYHANACYLKATFMQEQTKSQLDTLVTRIKCMEGYMDNLPVAYIGSLNDESITTIEQFDQLETIPYVFDTQGYLSTYSWKGFMRMWNGYAPKEVPAAEFEQMDEVINMAIYPDDGSIKIIEGTIIVKFRDCKVNE